jgi:hypothetical protein
VTDPLHASEAVLTEATPGVAPYGTIVEELTQKVSNLQESLPNWTRAAVLATYFLLIWLSVSQIGLLWQGWEMVSEDPSLLEHRLRDLEKKVEGLVSQG